MFSWHEERLRESDPLLKLLYWDFTENPLEGTNLFTDNFMGASTGTVSGPLGAALPVNISRNVGGTAIQTDGTIVCSQAMFSSDAFLSNPSDYSVHRNAIESVPNHDSSHGFIGGYGSGSGEINDLLTAVHDPSFFLLHANVDRQWATWQRRNALPSRLDTVALYGADSSHSRILTDMSPWDGDTGTSPWVGAAAIAKTSKDPSIVFSPIYDTAPLNIPVLQPEECIVIEITWYPPNVNNFNCMGDSGHFCLLARIETETTSPFGMTFPETIYVSQNMRNNNNIAWKNLTNVDDVSTYPLSTAGTTVHNFFERDVFFGFRLVDRTTKRRHLLQEFASMGLLLPTKILERMTDCRRNIKDLKIGEIDGFESKVVLITGKELFFSVPLKPGERFTIQLVVRMLEERMPEEFLEEPFVFDVEQLVYIPSEIISVDEARKLDLGGCSLSFRFCRD